MNAQWTNITGFGPTAWNHGGEPLFIPSTHYHNEGPGDRNPNAPYREVVRAESMVRIRNGEGTTSTRPASP